MTNNKRPRPRMPCLVLLVLAILICSQSLAFKTVNQMLNVQLALK